MRRATILTIVVASAGCGQLLGVDDLRDRDDAALDVSTNDAADAAPETCTPANGACSTFPQCGCEASDNCEIGSPTTGITTCSAAGTTPLWSPCGGNGECQRGATCVGNVCKPFCSTAADCQGTNVTCEQIKNLANGKDIPGFKVCSSGCDLENPSAICGPNVTCWPYPWDGNGKDHGDCAGTSGTATGPDACSGTNTTPHTECALGWYCLADKSCMKWCRDGHNGDCTSGQTCVAFSAPTVAVAGVVYGLCTDTD